MYTEGMSYAMMIAPAIRPWDVFDSLWGWVCVTCTWRTVIMRVTSYGRSRAPGTLNSNGPAPDGEEYFAVDLFLASRRWGDGEDI